MLVEKAHWNTNGNTFTFTMPITKIDKENRIVSGFGTVNNVDLQKDVVDIEASRKAFNEWAGNVRMMHDRIPAGKAVDIMEKQFTADDGVTYDGMYLDVYISKGAPNVWEMVLDETLKGFSIAGHINDYVMKQVDGESVRFITDYTLTELSLVDAPANHMAKIMSIQKSADGAVQISSIYDNPSESSDILKEEESVMSMLSKIYATISRLTTKGGNEVSVVEKAIVQPDTASVVQPDKRLAADVKRNSDGKYIGTAGGSDLGTEGADVPGLLRTADDEAAVVEETTVDDTVTTDAAADEVADTDNDEFAKQLNVVNTQLLSIAEIVEKLNQKITALETNTQSAVTKSLDEIVGRLKAVELETAQKQSGDIAKSTVVVPRKEQSFWGGAILKTSDL